MRSKSANGSVRIIAGEWRSRRLPVLDIPGLRPSGDRARETLFNWLGSFIPGANCVDLFAGTGALGFEAASRGAESVLMIESNSRVVAHLNSSIELLGASQVMVHHGDALSWLESQAANRYNIIFVDPPFQDHLHDSVLKKIEQSGCLTAGGHVYLETPVQQPAPVSPAGWSIWREKVMGDVRLQVFRR